MEHTRAEYLQRLKEVDLYFSTFKVLDNSSCTLESVDIAGNHQSLPINSDLIKIIKANGFILLYNLVEATVRNSITAVINSIEVEHVTYKMVTDEMRNLWIKQEFKSIKEIERIRSRVQSLLSEVLDDAHFALRSECVSISGNIDAQEIRNISRQIGCSEPRDGSPLFQIKNKRNELAHGEKTFCEIGKDFTIQDLIRCKEETTLFLETVIANMENYISTKAFLRN